MTATGSRAALPPSTVRPAALLADVRMRGVEVTMAYVPDEAERRRRAAAGLTGVTRADLLDVLLGLPAGATVPWTALSARERRAVRELPPGCADLTPTGVVRRLRRPLRPELAIVRAASWRAGLDRAGRFGAYCARLVVLPGPPADLGEARAEADYWGVGLVAGTEVIVPPEPFGSRAHTPAGWVFAEELHLRTLRAAPA
ncbi:hypothetical protein [Actinoallomurus soli]|uniref:hypothetical protein n=1 Tax=Actinoallomurus soli TaxID=2952535 RepID=UPI002092A21E|nr:hypothetical protein [Actinoallomurus soli]MCO5973146.1 hypothetical protein [Actinoallomurus soli]